MWKKREKGLDPYETYYLFLDYDITRMGTRLPNGEMEEITFDIKTCVMSQNILLLKLLELECRNMEMEYYIDEMLGVRTDKGIIEDFVKDEFPKLYPKPVLGEYKKYMKGMRESFNSYTGFFGKIKAPKFGSLRFFKPGSYEKDFRERISKNYSTVAGATFVGIVEFIKMKMGVE